MVKTLTVYSYDYKPYFILIENCQVIKKTVLISSSS